MSDTENTENPESTWFGETSVSPKEKTEKVLGVFHSVADNYNVMNDVMSMGIHRMWKDRFVGMINPKAGLSYLDVAGGTGDIAFRLYKKTKSAPDITVCDINTSMLSVGRDLSIDKGYINGMKWVTGNAESLPLPSKSKDVYTIAFGLRNVTHIDKALKEAYRVLKPGGRFYCLEFSHLPDPAMQKLYDSYSYNVIPKMGEIVAKDAESYQYLVESIRKFPKQDALVARIQDAGFDQAGYKNLSCGIAAMHWGWKL
jgi:demethylmenaquinone methyltransferase/2-methoxy-6-polyprenyl-1,4-benzoquinol methylase